jgi:hypothetical protein
MNMKTITDRFYEAMEHQLAGAKDHADRIRICKKAMNKLKSYMTTYGFESTEEEIHFFKNVKPRFYARYIYFVGLFNYNIQRPLGTEEIQRDYIRHQLDGIKRFFDQNRAFYQYYRAGMTQMDPTYFARGGFRVQAEIEDFEEDKQFSTSHDYKLSKLMANERYQEYLLAELARLNAEPAALIQPFKHPNWTAGQTDAIELIYALKASGSVNNGNIDIAELVTIFEYVFQMELKEYYHKFTDITRRKKDMAIFLNKLKDGLIRWVNDKMAL